MILEALREAVGAGARLKPACAAIGVTSRTVQRWVAAPDSDDRRLGPKRRASNALTTREEVEVDQLLDAHAHISPKTLVPALADQDKYVASESTFYRRRRARGLKRRGAAVPRVRRAKAIHRTTRPNQVWSWDITWLPTLIHGRFLFLYLVMDVWSRRIVGWRVEEHESADLAGALIQDVCRAERIDPKGLVLHSDNGSPMRGSTMVATLQWLGIVPSFSRPHVSNDNPYSESLFRTLKYTGGYPGRFATVVDARAWVTHFVAWYNAEHLHSGIRYVTPNQRHYGQETEVLAARKRLYEKARRQRPERWSGATRNWEPIATVMLNPERELGEG